MTNKTEKLAKIVGPLLRISLRTIQKIAPTTVAPLLRACRNVFRPTFLMLLLDDTLRRTLKKGVYTVSTQSLWLETDVALKVDIDLGDYIQRRFYLYGYPDFIFPLLSYCDKTTAFFDIGANIGLISLAVAQRVSPENIFAIEPIRETFKKLKTNLAVNCSSAKAFRLALSDTVGKNVLKIPSGDSGNASLEHDYTGRRIVSQGYKDTIHSEECECMPFDSFLLKESIELRVPKVTKVAVKIDVEGHEHKVLLGMKKFLQRTDLEVFLVIEIQKNNVSSIVSFLKEFEFYCLSHSFESLEDVNLTTYGVAQDIIFFKPALTAGG